MQTLERSHANGNIVLHRSAVSRNLLGVERIDIIDGVALEMEMQFMKVCDSLEFDGRDIWDSTELLTSDYGEDPDFRLW